MERPKMIDLICASPTNSVKIMVDMKDLGKLEGAAQFTDILVETKPQSWWQKIPKFEVSNISHYYFQVNPKEFWDLNTDFPNLAPPYDQFWIEYELPDYSYSKEEGVTMFDQRYKVRLGFFFYCSRTPEGWRILVSEFAWTEKRPFQVEDTHSIFMLKLDNEGEYIENTFRHGTKKGQVNAEVSHYPIDPCLLTLSLMNHNSRVVTVARSEALKKKDVQRGKPRVNDFKLIQVIPAEEVKKTARRATISPEQVAGINFRLCLDRRGNWASYGPKYGKGLLFGKYEGRFWRPDKVTTGRNYAVKVSEKL